MLHAARRHRKGRDCSRRADRKAPGAGASLKIVVTPALVATVPLDVGVTGVRRRLLLILLLLNVDGLRRLVHDQLHGLGRDGHDGLGHDGLRYRERGGRAIDREYTPPDAVGRDGDADGLPVGLGDLERGPGAVPFRDLHLEGHRILYLLRMVSVYCCIEHRS